MKAVMVGRQQGKTVAANRACTALELAASACWPMYARHGPVEVLCVGCGVGKKLHGVWVNQKWYCPFCVSVYEVTYK